LLLCAECYEDFEEIDKLTTIKVKAKEKDK